MNKKKIIKIIFFIVITMLFIIFIGLTFNNKKENTIKNQIVNYKEQSNTKYLVYLKENNFFTNPFLEQGGIYITSLIDYLDIDFNYKINFSKNVSGSCKYYIKGIISATKQNSQTSYWNKEYILKEEEVITLNNLDYININSNIKINYDYYNDILLEFRKTFNLSLDGNLKIVLIIENNIEEKNIYQKESLVSLEIPLTKKTIEVPISINDINNSSYFEKETYKNNSYEIIYMIISSILLLLSSIGLIYIFRIIILDYRNNNIYERKLRKILKEYDSIIVTLSNDLDLANLKRIYVKSFNELIDAHSEVRQPINYIEKDNFSKFILINNDVYWCYILRKGKK